MFINEGGAVVNDGAAVINGAPTGPMSGMVHGNHEWNSNYLRPMLVTNSRGIDEVCVALVTNKSKRDDKTGVYIPKAVPVRNLMARGIFSPVWNAVTMRKDDWVRVDQAVVRATRQRLRLVADLKARVGVGGFDAMSKMTYEYEAMSDPGEAVVDMDAIADGRNDSPLFKLRSVPLPITHSDWMFSQRRVMVSRNSSTPLDTVAAEAGGRRIGETLERTAIGTETGLTFGTVTTGPNPHDGTSTVYGLTNFPNRVTKTDLTVPNGTNGDSIRSDIIAMRETMYANGFFGPFGVYYSTGYDAYLDKYFSISGGNNPNQTVRQAILTIEGVESIKRLDFLTSGYQIIMVQLTSDVIQYINGMEPTTVQWQSQGGLRNHFKIMAIGVTLLKAPYNGVAAVIHGTTS